MMKILHIVAIGGLIASAGYVYRVKYDTIYQAEQVAKIKNRVQRERDAIAVLRAEWQKLDRPERVQALVAQNMESQPISVSQFVHLSDIPVRQPKTDEIGRKLELLGLGMPTETPKPSSAPKVSTYQSAPNQSTRMPITTTTRAQDVQVTGSTRPSAPSRNPQARQ